MESPNRISKIVINNDGLIVGMVYRIEKVKRTAGEFLIVPRFASEIYFVAKFIEPDQNHYFFDTEICWETETMIQYDAAYPYSFK